eukprot:4718202-Amphidinium_carterae.1
MLPIAPQSAMQRMAPGRGGSGDDVDLMLEDENMDLDGSIRLSTHQLTVVGFKILPGAFGKHADLERFAHLLCHLHPLHRTQLFELLKIGARISQYLKTVKQIVLDGGSWKVSWSLTGVPEPHPTGSLYQVLSSAAEVAASVQFPKDSKTIE